MNRELPEAMSVMGFAFYVTPMLLPLRAEMPAGSGGDKIMRGATLAVILGVAQVVYGCLGVFGAARHGLATTGNILSNRWLPPHAQVPCLILKISKFPGRMASVSRWPRFSLSRDD